MHWKIILTEPARIHLESIKDTRIKEQISRRIDALAENPDKQGKPLGEELFDFRSVRVVKERYRVIYKIKKEEIIVLVVMIGIRKEGDKKDVYALAKKLARLGLLDLISFPEPESESDNQPEVAEE
jgi:mRNA interferase RelE/StbE